MSPHVPLARAVLVSILTVVAATVVGMTTAGAQETDDGESVDEEIVLRGTTRAGEVIPGVTISVTGPDGNEVATVVTDDDGRWSVTVTELGDYSVTLDESTLPDGITLADGVEATTVVEVTESRSRAVNFRLAGGESTVPEADSTAQRLFDRAVSGIRVGLLVALAAVGLSLIFGVTGLVNFAHSELVAFGAIIAFAIEEWTSLPFVAVVALAVMAGGLLGAVLELGLFGPLRRRKMSNISLMVVSIGLAFVLRYLLLIYFGGEPKTYTAYRIQRSFDIGPISLPPKDYWIIGVSLVVLVAVGVLLQRTKLGTAMRAVSDNPALAQSSGIDVNRTILAVWIWGSALAGLGGVFLGLTQKVEWQMGERILLLIFAAVTLGGLGTAYGAMVGGLTIGFASEMSTFWLDNDLKFMVALVILILVLLLRPQGILGVRERFG